MTQRTVFLEVLDNWRSTRLSQIDRLFDGPDKEKAKKQIHDIYGNWLEIYDAGLSGYGAYERTIRALIEESHATAIDKGWWGPDGKDDRNLFEQLFLMHTELSEAGEELRNNHNPGDTYYDHHRAVKTPDGTYLSKPEGFLSELVDVFIRIGDTVGRYGLTDNFLLVLEEKLRYNKYRPYRHGGKTA